jgi:UDP-N-acetylglucosamine--N-acetylmuramyl-(pentapeptide) pyrophosphoryl-undecaprenol N-acetylglucosamine transferase
MKSKTLAVVAGGTAGHIFPALALGEILATTNRVIFLTDNRGMKYFHKQTPVIVTKFNLKHIKGFILNKLIATFWIVIAIIKIIYLFKKDKVQLVIAFGSLINLPSLLAAKLLKIPFILHEQNAILGKANQFFLHKAEFIATSFQDTKGLENYCGKIIYTGNPIRKEIFYSKRRRTKITREIQILVIGGSQGASIFDQEVTKALLQLPRDIHLNINLFQQASDIVFVENIYHNNHFNRLKVAKFFPEIGQFIADSDLIITRGGASTLSEIEYFGIPTIIIPLARAANNHQLYNAKAFSENGFMTFIEEENITQLSHLLLQTLMELPDIKKKSKPQVNQAAEKLAIKVNNFLISRFI